MAGLGLLWGTLLLRPYVFLFLGIALAALTAEQGLRRALRFGRIRRHQRRSPIEGA